MHLFPQAYVEVAPIPLVDGLQISPPVHIPAVVEDLNIQGGASLGEDDSPGRFMEPAGEAAGQRTPVMQDTYLNGTAAMSGRAMTATGGTWTHFYSEWAGKYGLFMPRGQAGQTFDIHDTAATNAGLRNALVVLTRGLPPAGASRNRATIKAYLEICEGSTEGNYRIALEFNQPIRIQYQAPGDFRWRDVASARHLGSLDQYLRNNNGQLWLWIEPDNERGILWVEVGEGNWLRAPAPRPHNSQLVGEPGQLPSIERYRFHGQNCWWHLEVYPLRYGPLKLSTAKVPYSRAVPNLHEAAVVLSPTGPYDAAQTLSGKIQQHPDGSLSVDVQASKPDAGEGLGSTTPPAIAQVDVLIPAVWTYWDPHYPVPDPPNPPTMYWRERQVWNDHTRMMHAAASVVVNNRSGAFTGSFGNYAFNLIASNGLYADQRMRGIIAGEPGLMTYRQDPVRLMKLNAQDQSYKLQRPLNSEYVFDGWCIYAAVRWLLEIGQISPFFLQRIPYWPPGRAGIECPYPVLGRGTGATPKYRYYPDRTVLSVLLELVQDAGAVHWWTGANVPYYMGFDRWGQFYFEPFDPRDLPVAAAYSDTDTGLGAIQEIMVWNSVEQMRTELNFQGQDAFTYELLHLHVPMDWNLPWVGFNYPWLERNERWASQDYLERIAYSAMVQGSLPTQILRMKVPYRPDVFAGQLIWVSERYALGRSGLFHIKELDASCGLLDWTGRRGHQDCHMWLTARAYENDIVF